MNTDRSTSGTSPCAGFEASTCVEHALAEVHRLRYQELFEFAPDCHLVTNSRGLILEANQVAASLFRCPKEFLIDKPLGLLVDAGVRGRFYECLARLGRTGGADEFEARLGRGANLRDVEVRATSAGTPVLGRSTYCWMIRDITQRRRADAARTELLRQLGTAQENERRRISREIHDRLGQDLTALTLGLKVLEADIPEGTGAFRRLTELRETVDRIGREAHELALELRPHALDDLGLRAALDTLIRRWSERAFVAADFHFDVPGNGRFASEVETAVYRVIQEALTNVARHARAGRVSVIVEHRDDRLVAIVEDDGCGFELDAVGRNGRLGLSGMNERVTLLDGTFHVESSREAGTTVRAHPLSRSRGVSFIMTKLRVLLADDHAVVREGLKALIDAQPDMEVVGETSDGHSAWLLAHTLVPDVVVMDVSMPVLGGADATELIRRDCPRTRVLALTVHEVDGYFRQLLKAGASGYILKRAAADELVRAIREVASGGVSIDPKLAAQLVTGLVGPPPHQPAAADGELTDREAEVVKLLARGHINREIAERLDLSVKTIEVHKARALQKLGLRSRADLVEFALQQGWLQID